jgi:hypothetical protein
VDGIGGSSEGQAGIAASAGIEATGMGKGEESKQQEWEREKKGLGWCWCCQGYKIGTWARDWWAEKMKTTCCCTFECEKVSEAGVGAEHESG